jgi:hypothetical protein
VIFPGALWATRSLIDEDYWRLALLAKRLPGPLVPLAIRTLTFLTRTRGE